MSVIKFVYCFLYFLFLSVGLISTQVFSNEKCWSYAPNTLHCNHEEIETLSNDEQVKPKEFPHIAYIGSRNVSITWFCLGSLISERYVLMGAHCAKNDRLSPTTVALGAIDINNISNSDQSQLFNVTETIVHPLYKKQNVYYDIALLRLDRNVQFTDYVRPICLNTDYNLKTTKAFTIAWALESTSETLNRLLWKSPLNIIPFSVCNETFSASGNITSFSRGISPQTHVCAERTNEECATSKGGALQIYNQKIRCMYTLIGISSVGFNCEKKGFPDAFTRIYPFIPWIELHAWY